MWGWGTFALYFISGGPVCGPGGCQRVISRGESSGALGSSHRCALAQLPREHVVGQPMAS